MVHFSLNCLILKVARRKPLLNLTEKCQIIVSDFLISTGLDRPATFLEISQIKNVENEVEKSYGIVNN